jgi:hypothetical protein
MMFADCATGHTFNQFNPIDNISSHSLLQQNKKSGFKERSRVTRSEEGSEEATHSNADD